MSALFKRMLAMLYEIGFLGKSANEAAKEFVHLVPQEHRIVKMSLVKAQAAVAARRAGHYAVHFLDPLDVKKFLRENGGHLRNLYAGRFFPG